VTFALSAGVSIRARSIAAALPQAAAALEAEPAADAHYQERPAQVDTGDDTGVHASLVELAIAETCPASETISEATGNRQMTITTAIAIRNASMLFPSPLPLI